MKAFVKWGGAFLLLALLVKLVGPESLYNSIRLLSPATLAVLVLLTLLARFFFSEALKYILKIIGYSLSSLESFHLVLVRGYFNQFFPGAGMGVIVLYLSKMRGINLSDYMVGNMAVIFSQYVSGGLLLLLLLPLMTVDVVQNVWILAALSLVSISFPMLLFTYGDRLSVALPERVKRYVSGVVSSWQRLQSADVHIKLIILNMAPYLVRGIRIWVIFYVLGFDVSVVTAISLSVTSDILTVLSITPAAIGVRELVFGLSATLYGLTFEDILAAALVDRAVMVVTLLLFGQISVLYLSSKVK